MQAPRLRCAKTLFMLLRLSTFDLEWLARHDRARKTIRGNYADLNVFYSLELVAVDSNLRRRKSHGQRLPSPSVVGANLDRVRVLVAGFRVRFPDHRQYVRFRVRPR